MGYTCNIDWEPLRSIDSATITSSTTYYPIGTPLLHPSYKLKMVNLSTVNVTVSKNGTSNIDIIPAGGSFIYDESQAEFPSATVPAVAQGTQFYVSSPTAGTGLIYMVSQFIVQN